MYFGLSDNKSVVFIRKLEISNYIIKLMLIGLKLNYCKHYIMLSSEVGSLNCTIKISESKHKTLQNCYLNITLTW